MPSRSCRSHLLAQSLVRTRPLQPLLSFSVFDYFLLPAFTLKPEYVTALLVGSFTIAGILVSSLLSWIPERSRYRRHVQERSLERRIDLAVRFTKAVDDLSSFIIERVNALSPHDDSLSKYAPPGYSPPSRTTPSEAELDDKLDELHDLVDSLKYEIYFVGSDPERTSSSRLTDAVFDFGSKYGDLLIPDHERERFKFPPYDEEATDLALAELNAAYAEFLKASRKELSASLPRLRFFTKRRD